MASSSVSSQSTSGSSDMLFACTNCHKRAKFEDLSTTQQLCKTCRKQFPLVTCTYCRLDFHHVKNSSDKESQPACDHCARDFKQHGTPSFCVICNLQSAFNGKRCTRCTHSEKKYGTPVACESCNLACAFRKPDDIRKKVDGKTLCLLCTINYKKAQFKKKALHSQQQQKSGHKASRPHHRHHLSANHSARHRSREEEPDTKRVKLDTMERLSPFPTLPEPVVSSQSLLGRDPQPMDLLSTNHMLETDKLQNEISSLKKQLVLKDQAMLDKDKQMCQLRAESLEKEKEYRTKLQSQQRSHSEVVETMQVEIRTLRKQISQSSHKGGQKGSSLSSAQNSLASLASSLSPAPATASSSS